MQKTSIYAPKLVRPTGYHITTLKNFLIDGNGKTLVITGAGLSTDSGIPDYRSPNGSYSRGHKPVTHQEFVGHESIRKRYWARSVFGIKQFQRAKPNRGHLAIKELRKAGYLGDLITQNVDRLHGEVNDESVIELHGHNHGVKCLSCNSHFSRTEYTEDLAFENEPFIKNVRSTVPNPEQRADGDAEIEQSLIDFNLFNILPCTNCGGVLMPTIVFFGGSIDSETKERATNMVSNSSQLIILGSSVQTYSAYRLLRQASEENKSIGIINLGETRGDSLASWKFECSLSESLSEVCKSLSLKF